MPVDLVSPDLVKPYAGLASKDRIQLKLQAKAHTVWFGAFTPKTRTLVGFAAIAIVGVSHFRLRGLWVRPDARGEGHSRDLIDARLRYLMRHYPPDGLVSCFQNAELDHEFYFARGFTDTGRRQSGSGAWYLEAHIEDLQPGT